MKTKIFLYASFLLGLSLASCNDDDNYFISTEPVIDESSVATGSSDVTANSATLYGTVKGLDGKSAALYTVGFYYGDSQDNLAGKVDGLLDGTVVSASIGGLTTGHTYYYQTYVSLKGQVTFLGEVKSFVTTNATITTLAAETIDFNSALLGGNATEMPADATVGVVIASEADVEKVRAGLAVPASAMSSTFTIDKSGLLPSTTYYYAAYLDLGAGTIYGEVESFTTAPHSYDVDEEFVDLGLSVKWAKSNLGSKSDTDMGGHFGFGDRTGVMNSYLPEDYASEDLYATTGDLVYQITDGKATLPSYEDFEELFSLCSAEWTTEDGVNGYRLTGPNGNSIFLPAAGSRTVNTVSSQGTDGYYATGSVNPNDTRYYYGYQFSSANKARTVAPVYRAMSIRPVSTARNLRIETSKLCRTWEIDFLDGASKVFNGPVWFYGTDDSWKNVTNNELMLGKDSWLWDADASNTWAFGNCSGSMTFTEDGKVTVVDCNGNTLEGTYTIDNDNYTITSTIDLLAPDNFVSPTVENRKTAIKVLALTDATLQLGYFRDSEPATLSVNMIPQTTKYGYAVTMMSVGGDWAGNWGTQVGSLSPSQFGGKVTFTYSGEPCNGAMVFLMDFNGILVEHPEVVITVADIRCDGKSVKYDPSKFFYGDIEDNGNYRIEFFNIWGKGSDGSNVYESPFSSATNVNNDPALSFTSSIEIDCYVSENLAYTPELVTINPNWGGYWDGINDGSFRVIVDDNFKLVPDKTSFDITTVKTSDFDYSDGSIMTFINTNGLMDMFPGTVMTLDAIELDGKALTGWDANKVINTNDNSSHRLELWNCYGNTNSYGCAFGTPEGDVIKELGFNDSMRLRFTINSLFTPVTW